MNRINSLVVLIALSVALPMAYAQSGLSANAGPDKTANAGDSVSFDGTGSTGSISSYNWDFGDGTTATGSTPTHVYSSAGTYTVTLFLIGTSGSTATDTASVIIRTADSTAPNITTTAPTGVAPGSAIDISATVTDNVAVAAASIYYKTGSDSNFNNTTMTCSGSATSKTCTGQIPASVTSATTINYYIRAIDTRTPTANVQTYPSNAPTGTINLTLADTAPPSITILAPGLSESATSGVNLTVSARITDNAGASGASVFYVFGTNGVFPSFGTTNVTLTRTAGTALNGTWTGTIDMTSSGSATDLAFYVRATDGTNNATLPSNAPVTYRTVGIASLNAPSISHTPPTGATAGSPLALSFAATYNNTAANVSVFYRSAGTSTFLNTSLPSTTTSFSIPADNVTDTGVEYYIRANDTSGLVRTYPSSGAAAPIFVGTPPTSNVGGLAASRVTGGVSVTWTAAASSGSSSVAGYHVWRSTDGSTYSSIANLTSGATTTYIDATPPIGFTAYYTLSAYDTATSEGSRATAVSLLVRPRAPGNFTASPDGIGSALASFDTVRSGAWYVVKTTGGATLANVTTGAASLTGLTPGTAYSLEVYAYSATDVASLASSTISLTPIGAAATPTGLSGTRTGSGIDLSWTNASTTSFPVTAGFRIQRSTTSATAGFTDLATTTSTTYSDATASAGTTYYYRVAALNQYGVGDYTSGVTVAVAGATPTPTSGGSGTTTTTTADTTAPTVSAFGPTGETTSTSPTITASYADLNGVVLASLSLKLDGVAVSPAAGSSGLAYTPTTPLALGTHTVTLTVADPAGNVATKTWTFSVVQTLATPTPTPTPTPTTTASPTPTPTVSATSTASPTPSATTTATATPSPGAHQEAQPTSTATAGGSPTKTASPTPTPSPTKGRVPGFELVALAVAAGAAAFVLARRR